MALSTRSFASLAALSLEEHGAQLFQGAAKEVLVDLYAITKDYTGNQAGIRLHKNANLSSLLKSDLLKTWQAQHIGSNFKPVRAILFDKSETQNWALGWHQDRTICVRRKVETNGFGPWSVKQSLVHVEPPFEFIERLRTIRIHLDDVPITNAPLNIALGSHKLGKVHQQDINQAIAGCKQTSCLAKAGDIWCYATPIVHASKRAAKAGNRRVLQLDYSPDELPGALEWLGVGFASA